MNVKVLAIVIAASSFSLAGHAEECVEAQWGGTDATYLRCSQAPVPETKHIAANTTAAVTSSQSKPSKGAPRHAARHDKAKSG